MTNANMINGLGLLCLVFAICRHAAAQEEVANVQSPPLEVSKRLSGLYTIDLLPESLGPLICLARQASEPSPRMPEKPARTDVEWTCRTWFSL